MAPYICVLYCGESVLCSNLQFGTAWFLPDGSSKTDVFSGFCVFKKAFESSYENW